MSARETTAIVTAREDIRTILENEEDAEDFHFTGVMHFIGNRVWHEILIDEPKILAYAFIDNFKKVHVAAGLDDAAAFDF